MWSTLNNLARLVSIARTLAKHDALFPLEQAGASPALLWLLRRFARVRSKGRPGERLAAAMIELGPSFIKFGQSLAVRSDIVGEDVALDLSTLHAHMPPFPSDKAIATIERELGAPLAALYGSFDRTPVAAASIAQVHFAVTDDGAEVAVKVLRPGIEAQFARDIVLFRWLAGLVERLVPKLRRLRPVDVVEAFADWVEDELDLRMEGAAASELAENMDGDPFFQVPKVDWRRTSRRVLTLERVNGIPINEVERLIEADIDPKEVLARSARAFFRQVFEHGFFHADMHPGNMFVGADGSLLPVDFGIMGRLDRKTRHYLADMLFGFLNGDYGQVADVHFAAGYIPRDQPRESFMQACRAIGEPIKDLPLQEISVARLLAQLFEVTARFEMETQPQLLLLQKTMLVAEGVGRRLDPDTNMWVVAHPLIEAWMVENRGPPARLRALAEDAAEFVAGLPELARMARRASQAITEDGLRLHPDTVQALKRRQGVPSGRVWLLLLAGLVAGLALGLLW
jgi:ubiquinone biosynthesis protein